MPFMSQPTVTRAANTTAYTAGDVVGGVITFSVPSGKHLLITSVDLRINISSIPSGMTSFRLHLYRTSPASAYADNAAWDLPSGDRAAYIGYVDMGTVTDLGSTVFVQTDQVNKHIYVNGGASAVYGYLQTIDAYTPAANSEEYVPCLRWVDL